MHVAAVPGSGSSSSLSTNAARADWILAAAAGGAALIVYLATMFPGLAAIGDTPKLQFVGRVLGTPHSPGYPLYMLVSALFARIPVASVAWRINFLSAVSGAVAVALIAGLLRELDCRPVVAAAGALTIAFGRVFWSQALLAEVYTLNAALFAGALLFFVRWARTRRDAHLLAAAAFVAFGTAHHLTLVMTAPAMLLYVLVVDARRALRPRVVLAALALLACGLGLYGLIWLRTVQGAPYLEAQARSVRDLVDVITARQFSNKLFVFSPRELVTLRVPVVAGWIAGELRAAGIVLLAIGTIALAVRRWREALLLAGCAGAVLTFAVNYDVADIDVFLILPMIVCGVGAAVGLETIARGVEAVAWRRGATGGVAVAAALLVLLQVRANLRENDQHQHTYEMEYFDAFFAQLPDRSVIVESGYTLHDMVLYKLLGEDAAGSRRIALAPPAEVPSYVARGYTAFAFEGGQAALAATGLPLRDARLRLPRPRQMRHVEDMESFQLLRRVYRVTPGDTAP